MKNSTLSEFTKHSLSTGMTQGVLLACAFVSSVISARILGPVGKGQMALVLLIPTLAMSFGRMGIGHAINFYSSKTERGSLIFNSTILGAIIGGILILLITPVVYMSKEHFFAHFSNHLLIIAISCIPIYLFHNIAGSLIQGMYYIWMRNFMDLFQAIANVVFLFLAVYYLHQGVMGAVLANMISMVIAVFISFVFLKTKINIKNAKLDRSMIKNLVMFGSKSHIGAIFKDLAYRGDFIIISYFLTTAAVGHYAVAVVVTEIIWKLPDAIGIVLLPKVAAMATEKARSFTPKVCRITIIPVFFVCITVLFLGEPMINLAFGNLYKPSGEALLLLLPGVFFLSLWKLLANDLVGQGYPLLFSITSGIALVTMVIFDLLLIPSMGINGAAIGSSLSYFLATIVIIKFYTKVTGNLVKDLVIPKRDDLLYYFKVIGSVYEMTIKKHLFKRRGNG